MLRRFFGVRTATAIHAPSAVPPRITPTSPPSPSPAVTVPSPSAAAVGVRIARTTLSHRRHEKADWKNLRLVDLNAKEAVFVDCDFSYSILDRAYLHKAKFERCRFVGCRFQDSNLRGASFALCDFKYSTFQRTLLDPEEIIANLPLEPNLRREALQNLRANAAEVGDYPSQRLFVLSEVEAALDHHRRAMRGSEDYYRRKYPGLLDKLRAAAGLARLQLGGAIWGHGERPARIAVSASVLLLVLCLVNLWAVIPRTGWAAAGSGLEVLRYGLNQLLDMQPDPRFKGFAIVDYALVAMRYIYIGLFISVLSRSISHR